MNDAVHAFEHFFNDIIAQIIPGGIFIWILSYTFNIPVDTNEFIVIALLALSYCSGHVILAVEEYIQPVLLLSIRKNKPRKYEFSRAYSLYKSVLTKSENITPTERELVEGMTFNELRSIAMSSSVDAANLGRRFMFLCLFCKGLMLALTFSIPFLLATYFSFKDFHSYSCYSISLFVLTVTILYPLQKRADGFRSRAMAVPFSCAIEMIFRNDGK